MWALLAPILSQIFGTNGPVGQFLKMKSDAQAAEQNYKIAQLNAQTKQVENDYNLVQVRLNSTTQEFKQQTFWFICVPVVLTMCPWTSDFAIKMWANFALIPDWFRILFTAVYSSIWGLPLAKDYLAPMFQGVADYRLQVKQAKYNRKAVFDVLRQLFPKGMNQDQVNLVDRALDAGEVDEINNAK